MRERSRLRSIPPRTTLDAWREQSGKRVSRRSPTNPLNTSGLTFGQTRHGNSQEVSGFDPNRYTFKKPTKEKSIKPSIVPETERITWEVEVHEDYDSQGGLGVILQFFGIRFANTPVFKKSKVNYGPDSSVFYSQIGDNNLILATYGDIFESQIVATRIDDNPFFREEFLVPGLTTTHDPTSMSVRYNNGLVVVGFNRL